MPSFMDPILDGVDSILEWLTSSLKQTTEAYCDLQTADSSEVLVAHDGSLVSMIRVHGVTALVGSEEFDHIVEGVSESLQSNMSRSGHTLQVFFNYELDSVKATLTEILNPAKETADVLNLNLADLFEERINHLAKFCADETVFLVLWTRPSILTKEQYDRAAKDKAKLIREKKFPPFKYTQNLLATIPDLRNSHESLVRALITDFNLLNIYVSKVTAHEALYHMRMSIDPDFTDREWRPLLPGDPIPAIKVDKKFRGEISDVMWPSLGRQLMPRDAENIDLRTVRIGDRLYSGVFIDLFPREIRPFISLFQRTLSAKIPWRISFLIDSDGVTSLRFKSFLAATLSWTSPYNRLISDATNLLRYIKVNSDDAIVKLRVATATWADEGDLRTLRTRTAQLAKAIEGWGSCEVSEISGDPFAGAVSSMLGISSESVATPSIAPLSDVISMLPITRPASPWDHGALLLRSPDGKPWPYQPGSRQQTTWIDLVYARPGSGKSVLSNALNLALCLAAGIKRLPRIAIIDIGPSSSGLISLLREALPAEQRHYVAYHRLRMTPDYAINPFDTQLGMRFPTPQERAFLVNFLTLLATPLGAERTYDGIPDMSGLVVDELYKAAADGANPSIYTAGMEPLVDGILDEIGFVQDQRTTWWEVTDALFLAGFSHEAMLAQRYAVPQLSDVVSMCRTQAVEDLYGQIIAPTGEPIITAFSRMISSAVREYPILSRITSFDLGDARVISLDLDEVAKSGGDAADRQTAVMYMLGRYVLGRNFYLTEEAVHDMPEMYQDFHRTRIAELREDQKRIVYDEFHRTAKAKAVRDQVIVDMREGRKWRVQVALLSQSLDDFDSLMIEFATSIFIMDAGPSQAINKTAEVFGLSETAKLGLRKFVHGPGQRGGTFLAQFSTKHGMNTQLLTLTLGPVELWAFSTTVEDVNIRNQLYKRLGPAEARRILAVLFPNGTITKLVEDRLNAIKADKGLIDDRERLSVIDELVEEIIDAYMQNPQFKSLTSIK
ncbi:MAG: type IV secretion protein IcmB [Legionellales bacterium]|nr:type IV secretion protein IcmB [Legionellales bacterium]